MSGQQGKSEYIRPVLSIVVGACSLLMIYAPLFFVGAGCAVAGAILAAPCLKRPSVRVRMMACIGMTLALTGAIAYFISVFSLSGRLGIV